MSSDSTSIKSKIDKLNAGESYIKHIEPEDIAAIVKNGTFEASADFSRIAEVEAILICVPTPLNKYREPDLSYVFKTGEAIATHLGSGIPNKLGSTGFYV